MTSPATKRAVPAGEPYQDAELVVLKVRMALRRERHNALADVESFCTGTVKKLKRYAPLLRHLARVKASIRIEMDATQNNYEHHQRKRNVR